MPHTGRVFARLMDWAAPATPCTDGSIKIRVEWSRLDGDRENGKSIFECEPATNVAHLAHDLVDALVDELNAKFPGEDFGARDILLWGS